METKSFYKMIEKRGLSTIVTTVILILLTLVAVGIVWVAVKNIITKPLENIESCFGNFDKVKINDRYTCYNASSAEFRFSINVEDIEIDELLISISNPETSKSFKISKTGSTYYYIRTYNNTANYGDKINLPGKNAGLTYVVNTTEINLENTESIKIAPVIGKEQCEVSDSLLDIDSCSLLA